MNTEFKFQEFSGNSKSLLVQAVEHVLANSEFEILDSTLLSKMSQELNKIIETEIAKQIHLPRVEINYKFQFAKIDDSIHRHGVIEVVDKSGLAVMRWEN